MRVVGLMLVLVLASGCNYVYGLDPTRAKELADSDGDGVYDDVDNCIDTANPPPPGQTVQLDVDSDTVGDACDNCPLLSNVEQRAAGDDDELGDLCDPHPTTGNDCLIVVDTFGDPARLVEHWQTISLAGDTAGVVAEVGRLRLRPRPSDVLALAARGGDGMVLAGDHDLLVRGTVALSANGIFHAVTDAAMPSFGYACGLRFFAEGPSVDIVVAAMGGPATTNQMPLAPPVDGDFVIRQSTVTAGTMFPKACRVEYGVSAGSLFSTGQQPTGFTGVRTVDVEVEITGIAITRYVASGACPAALRR